MGILIRSSAKKQHVCMHQMQFQSKEFWKVESVLIRALKIKI